MKKHFLTVALFALCLAAVNSPAGGSNPSSASLPNFSTPVTREELRQAYYTYSGPAIVKELWENDAANWNMIMDNVSAGDADWIASVVRYVFPGTDAAATTEVIVSLAQGLSENPEAVLLQEIGPHISMLSICSLPFIEPEYDFITGYGEKTLAALRNVNKPHLIDSRDTCIRRLSEGLAHARKTHAEGRWE